MRCAFVWQIESKQAREREREKLQPFRQLNSFKSAFWFLEFGICNEVALKHDKQA